MLQGTAHVYCIAMLPGSISTDLSVKALHAMTDGVPSKVTFASFLQFRKASESMIITLLGMVTSVSGAPEKAPSPICVIPCGMWTSFFFPMYFNNAVPFFEVTKPCSDPGPNAPETCL